ncbi:hypothetical protein DL98DRAFT_55152 [Cadophora sp. DSE1049]|nr:hypothetical protein DL98DRAFT_55152 [Cadophora sp. DSE1049]
MAQQSNFSFHDPYFPQGSPEKKDLSGNAPLQARQAQRGGSAMSRDLGLSSQSNDTTASSISNLSNFTGLSTISTNSLSTQGWGFDNDSDSFPGLKYEDVCDFETPMDFPTGAQFGGDEYYQPLCSQPYNSQNEYAQEYTPSSLGWELGTDLVDKYNLILNKNKHYLQIINEDDVTWKTPARVNLEPISSSQKGEAHCHWPGKCNRQGEPFSRPADLERHLKNVHGPRDLRDKHCCPYNPCLNGRHLKKNSFTRKDHLRDHVRDFHQEDIGAAKGEKTARTKEEKRQWQKEQEKWIASRKITPTHWTCTKCVVRMIVAEHGWHCTECNQPCEPERIDMRLRLSPSSREEAQVEMDGVGGMVREEPQPQHKQHQGYLPCQACSGSGWVDNGYGEWDPCPYCNYDEHSRVGARTFQ